MKPEADGLLLRRPLCIFPGNDSLKNIMEPPVLTQRDLFPTEEVIFSHIGRAKPLWLLLFDHIHREHSDFTEQWRYYNDGKSWLLKVSRKTKTIFWLSVVAGAFRTTFYFTDKAREAISKSALSDELKTQYRSGKKYGKIRGLTIVYRRKRDVEDARRLIDIKTGTGKISPPPRPSKTLATESRRRTGRPR